ncbi:MAG: hypothetical protein ABEJ83_03725 [Candidatus Nanohaloarchaea archaeon]
MQPHAPYIGFDVEHFGFSQGKGDIGAAEAVWSKVKEGELSLRELREGYKNNLDTAKEYVEKLNKELEGKTIITADHGDFLGENGLFGHDFEGSNAKILRKVPWEIREED